MHAGVDGLLRDKTRPSRKPPARPGADRACPVELTAQRSVLAKPTLAGRAAAMAQCSRTSLASMSIRQPHAVVLSVDVEKPDPGA